MDTYYVRGKGYDFRTQSEAFFEIAFDVDNVNAKSFMDAYREALKGMRDLEVVRTEYIVKL